MIVVTHFPKTRMKSLIGRKPQLAVSETVIAIQNEPTLDLIQRRSWSWRMTKKWLARQNAKKEEDLQKCLKNITSRAK